MARRQVALVTGCDGLRRAAIATTVVSGGWVTVCLVALAQSLGMAFALELAAPGALVLVPAVCCWQSLPEHRGS
jgi:hypothetical protein